MEKTEPTYAVALTYIRQRATCIMITSEKAKKKKNSSQF